MSVKELKQTITDGGLSHADCFEKPELRMRATAALDKGATPPGTSTIRLSPGTFRQGLNQLDIIQRNRAARMSGATDAAERGGTPVGGETGGQGKEGGGEASGRLDPARSSNENYPLGALCGHLVHITSRAASFALRANQQTVRVGRGMDNDLIVNAQGGVVRARVYVYMCV